MSLTNFQLNQLTSSTILQILMSQKFLEQDKSACRQTLSSLSCSIAYCRTKLTSLEQDLGAIIAKLS